MLQYAKTIDKPMPPPKKERQDLTKERMVNRNRQQQFAEAIELYGASLRRLVRSYTKDQEEQKDLEQDIAMALWKALVHFKGDCSLRTFVFRIAHNCSISKILRKRSSRPQHTPFDETQEATTTTEANAEQQLDMKQRQQQLIHAVQSLPLKYRQVVTLALEELPHAEIAEVLGISISNVAVRLNRGKEQLRTILRKERI